MNAFTRVAIAMVVLMGLTATQAVAEDMKPPAELAEMAKIAGTWKCKGTGMDHSFQMSDMAGTLKVKSDVGGWWIHSSFEATLGKDPFMFEAFTTFDPSTKKWRRMLVESGGAWSTGESAGMKAGKAEWEMQFHTAMGEGAFRDHEDITDAKAGTKMWGEFSPDGGKTWIKVYEMACKK